MRALFDGKIVMDNVNSNLETFKDVKLFQGSPNPYTSPGPDGADWAKYYVTPDVSFEYFHYENFI